MGLCVSVASSVHDADYGIDDNVVVIENNYNDVTSGDASSIGSVYSQQGSKGINQDAAIFYQGYGSENGVLCGVFDGHGQNGHVASKIVRNRLPSMILNKRLSLGKITDMPSNSSIKWKDACESCFKMMDKELKDCERLDFSFSGTTAVVVVRQGDDLVIANLGDSRAILGTKTEDGIKAVQLTTDLKPCVPAEADRIRRCNGRILCLREEPHIQRVWLPHQDSPGLAMSRALGDFILKNHGIIAMPDVSYHRISPSDDFIVLATDGVSK
ncbi:hypothetical protein Leryth_004959 [Lithospermum erythrorhizon]|nr:hypothetical protein Leryth_004959 [Lithospermum erythrorhizon]